MDFQSKRAGHSIPKLTATRQRDASPLGEGISNLFRMELSQANSQIIRNKTPEDNQGLN
jgi:hypothetical protein